MFGKSGTRKGVMFAIFVTVLFASVGGYNRDRRDTKFFTTKDPSEKRPIPARFNRSWSPVLPAEPSITVIYGPEDNSGTIRVSYYDTPEKAPQRKTFTPDRTVRPSLLTSRYGVSL